MLSASLNKAFPFLTGTVIPAGIGLWVTEVLKPLCISRNESWRVAVMFIESLTQHILTVFISALNTQEKGKMWIIKHTSV